MLTPSPLAVAGIVARKEMVDAWRDFRSVLSALFYALMGPLVVGLVAVANPPNSATGAKVLVGMMSVFTLVAAFVGGMNVAMDTIAGERERHSLLPLLLNPVPRFHLLLGKWLAVSAFAVAGLALNLAGFAVVFARVGLRPAVPWPQLTVILLAAIFPLTLLAASAQIFISTVCRAIKEAQTYLSLIVFLPMALGMFLVFFPAAQQSWCGLLPLIGQQLQLQYLVSGGSISLLQPLVLGALTVALALLLLLVAANRLYRDEIIYGD